MDEIKIGAVVVGGELESGGRDRGTVIGWDGRCDTGIAMVRWASGFTEWVPLADLWRLAAEADNVPESWSRADEPEHVETIAGTDAPARVSR